MTLVSIYDVPCPFCGREQGFRCVVVPLERGNEGGGQLRVRPHVARRRAYREAAAK